MANKAIKPDALGAALAEQLTMYGAGVVERINACGEDAIKELVARTRKTAPKRSGRFRKHITYTAQDAGHGGKTFVWHVKAPLHRITHLLVHGHATKSGGRVVGDPFLSDALAEVLPAYENALEEAVKNDT